MPTSSICKSKSRRLRPSRSGSRAEPRQVLDVGRRMDQSRPRARRPLYRQHQARPDLVAGYEDQLQLQLGRAVRPLHRLPSRRSTRRRPARRPSRRIRRIPRDQRERHRATGRRRRRRRRPLPGRKPGPSALVDDLRHGACSDCGRSIRRAVTVQVVVAESLAAMAGLADRATSSAGNQRRRRSTRRTTSKHYLLDIVEWGKPMEIHDSSRTGSAVHIAPAARSCLSAAPARTEGRDGLHDLPRRAGQRDRFQVGFAHAERSAPGARLVARSMVGSTTITGFSR